MAMPVDIHVVRRYVPPWYLPTYLHGMAWSFVFVKARPAPIGKPRDVPSRHLPRDVPSRHLPRDVCHATLPGTSRHSAGPGTDSAVMLLGQRHGQSVTASPGTLCLCKAHCRPKHRTYLTRRRLV
eukprot:118970-Chlamydomonas_euryale.AAC.2